MGVGDDVPQDVGDAEAEDLGVGDEVVKGVDLVDEVGENVLVILPTSATTHTHPHPHPPQN